MTYETGDSIYEAYGIGDSIYEAYGIGGSIPFYTKVMDRIEIGINSIRNIEIDVGILPKEHKGLLGLDILKQQNFIIDLKTLELHN